MKDQVLTTEVRGSTRFSVVLPHSKICRTKSIGTLGSFAGCLVESPDSCPYVIFSGAVQFCTHPRWEGFVHLGEAENGG